MEKAIYTWGLIANGGRWSANGRRWSANGRRWSAPKTIWPFIPVRQSALGRARSGECARESGACWLFTCRENSMTKERGGSFIFLAAGIYGMALSMRLPFGRWNEPGAGVFPLVLSFLLCVCGISWFLRGKGEKKESVGLGEFLRRFVTPLKILGITAAFILFLEPLGYLLSSTLYLFVLLLWVSRYGLWVAMVLSLAFGPGSWLFFSKLLSTPLPKGFLPI